MALQKQAVEINFAMGLDTKTDPNQVQMGKFLELENSVFGETGLLKKRNGFVNITQAPEPLTTLTTLHDGLIGINSGLLAYSADSDTWLNTGALPQVTMEAIPASRGALSQSEPDSATSPLGLTCSAFIEGGQAYYQVIDATNGQIIAAKTLLPSVGYRPRVFILGPYFIIVYIRDIAGTFHIQYLAVPLQNPNNPGTVVDISSQVDSPTDYWDGVVANNGLYIFWNASDVGGAIRAATLTSTLALTTQVLEAGLIGNKITATIDTSQSSNVIWVLTHDTGTGDAQAAAYNQNLLTILAPTLIFNETINNFTAIASDAICSFLYEVANVYPTTAISSPYINKNTITQAGVIGSPSLVKRSVGLASKAFVLDNVPLFVAVYGGEDEPTNFLLDFDGAIYAKFAPSNSGGYLNCMLPSVSIQDESIYFVYTTAVTAVPINRVQGSASAPILEQLGINILKSSINQDQHSVSELANVLNITGGYLWMYDGSTPVEAGFHVFPEDILISESTGAGALTAQPYFYQVTYEWTDAIGNVHRSAPSLPVSGTITGGNNTNTLQIPTLRLTAKTGVRIVVYRWSAAQQVYYQVTDINPPVLNDTSVDTITYVDIKSDAQILGNTILYTTGGVLENIAAPACYASTNFRNRLFLVTAEDRNLIWYSKTVLQATPVEMTDLQTIYVAPSASSSFSGNSGPITALSSMDDKLIIFRRDAIYYISGNGPDATGTNNDYSEPIFVTSVAGCNNPESIVFMPNGIMFQSDKGIWLLGRDLSTSYIGADVEEFNDAIVLSALTVPGTNQVRLTLSNGTVLMYDYYMQQWGTFSNVPAVSSTLYQGAHTYVNSSGMVRQEHPGLYLDGSSPVLVRFTSAWFKLTNLQGFSRAYFMHLLGTYFSPHKLAIDIAFDYVPYSRQGVIISPTNFSPAYGNDALYGSGNPYGGENRLEQWRVFFDHQKCQSIRITIQEQFDPNFGTAAGAGLTLSGLNLTFGAKLPYPTTDVKHSVG